MKDLLEPFRAIFEPVRIDDLRPSARQCIGQEWTFSYGWTMDEDDPYPGEVAYLVERDWPEEAGIWVPERDLRSLTS